MSFRFLLPLFLLLAASPMPVFGQLLIRVTQANQISGVNNGGSITIAAKGIGQQSVATLAISYIGTGTGITFQGLPELLGSTDFTFLDPPPPNATIGQGQTLTLRVAYTPSSSLVTSADFRWTYNETLSENTSRQGLIALGFNGIAPEFKVAYAFAIDGNVVQLPDQNGNIPFIPTPLNNTTTATIAVINRGSGPGELQSVTVSGDAFSLISLPLLPINIASGGTTSFQVRYRPRAVGTDTGTLTLTYGGGVTQTVTLTGTGISSYFTYELLPPNGEVQRISPSQVVVLPPTNVGQRTTSFVRFRNDSPFDISATAISVTGSAFSLADVPFLPVNVAPGESYLFSLIFAPTEAGRQTGRLRVGNDTFELAGEAIGSRLSYSYRTTAGTTDLQPLQSIVFPAVAGDETSVVNVTVENRGSAPAPISNIGISQGSSTAFSLANLPPLPSAIPPGGSITFQVRFRPLAGGATSASLLINGVSFPLVAFANELGALPDYTITGPTTVQPFDQPRVGLTLVRPYGVTVRGTLTLTPEADTGFADSAIQFASGGRTASFTIPAGSTSAIFFNGSTEIRFQAGTAAGSFYITPTFFTEGGTNVTPEVPRTLRIVLLPAAPRLILGAVSSITNTTFTVQVTGVSTTRSISRVRVTFKGKPGFNIPTTEFTLDTTGQSLLWFQSAGSSGFGGQFTAVLPFTLRSSDTGSGATPPTQAIESVTVVFENAQGSSNELTVPVS